MMALTLVQGRWVTLKMRKNGLLPISQTLISVESWNLYHTVANDNTFFMDIDKMTLTLIQGRWMTLEMRKNRLLPISQTLISVES